MERYSGDHFLLVGTFGGWRGRESGGIMSWDLSELIRKCVQNVDYATFELTDEGTIEFTGYHHDGTNQYTIMELNGRAWKTIEKWEDLLSERELHEKLNCKYYTKKIQL